MNDHWAVHSAVPVEGKMNHYPIAWAVMLLNGRRVERRDGKEPSGSFFRSRTSRSENERKRRRTHVEEISRLARGMVGRELRMIEMKKEVNELCHRVGEVVRYPLEFEQGGKASPDSPQPRNQP